MGFYATWLMKANMAHEGQRVPGPRHGSHAHVQLHHGPDASTGEKPRASRLKRFCKAALKCLGNGLEGLANVVLGVGKVVLGLVAGTAILAGGAIVAVAGTAVLAVGAVVAASAVLVLLPVLVIFGCQLSFNLNFQFVLPHCVTVLLRGY